tara:strand:- start:289 stop:570 length:282 start_codon:yes stop_codon:yes gene_type:complete
MARTLTLNSFNGTDAKALVKGTKLLNMTISNIHASTTPEVEVKFGSVFVTKDLLLPIKTSIVLFDTYPLECDTSTITVNTNTASSIEVVYTID